MISNSSRQAKGFTLIELMIATSLLMAVLFAGYYGFSLYSQKWQKRVNTFWQETEQVMALEVINKLLLSSSVYTVSDQKDNQFIYFSGDSHSIRFVTGAGLFSSNTALVELALESRDEQGYQLIYKERSLVRAPLFALAAGDDQRASIIWQNKLTLLPYVEELKWSYYGWTTYTAALAQAGFSDIDKPEDTRQWYSQHITNKSRVLPIYVKLTMKTASTKFLSSEFSELLVPLPNHSLFTLLKNNKQVD